MAIQQSIDGGLRELALFAGAGGGILGGKLLGWRTVCAVERDAYAAQVLAQRQNDGILEPFPIWSDVCSFDGKLWRGIVDVVSGGFPCQDISVAGKGVGITGARSGMWSEMARIIGEIRPRFAFVENSPALVARGLGVVLADLAALGYDCRWGVLGAVDVGANHQRDRFWLVATDTKREPLRNTASENLESEKPVGALPGLHGGDGNVANTNLPERRAVSGACDGLAQRAHSIQREREEGSDRPGGSSKAVADADRAQREGNECPERIGEEYADIGSPGWWSVEPNVGRTFDGLAEGMDGRSNVGQRRNS